MGDEIVVERERRHGIWFRLAVNTVAIWVAGAVLAGVHVNGILGAAVAAVLITVVNAIVRPVLIFLTFPITIVTLGLFLLVVNALTLWLAAGLAGSLFDIDGLGSAIIAWLVVWAINWTLTAVFRRESVKVVTR